MEEEKQENGKKQRGMIESNDRKSGHYVVASRLPNGNQL